MHCTPDGRPVVPDGLADFADLSALFINCSLKRSPEVSHTDGLIGISRRIMEAHGVAVEHGVAPLVVEPGGAARQGLPQQLVEPFLAVRQRLGQPFGRALARMQPERDHIGIEIRRRYAWRVAYELGRDDGPRNCRIIWGDAKLLSGGLFDDATVLPCLFIDGFAAWIELRSRW